MRLIQKIIRKGTIGTYLTTNLNFPKKRSESWRGFCWRHFTFGDAWWSLERKEVSGMSRRCEFTGKGPMSGNNVSHANNKTRRRFLPNLNDVTLQSEALGRGFKVRISAAALRSVDHRGGLDAFLAKAKDSELSSNALKVKKEIERSAQTSA